MKLLKKTLKYMMIGLPVGVFFSSLIIYLNQDYYYEMYRSLEDPLQAYLNMYRGFMMKTAVHSVIISIYSLVFSVERYMFKTKMLIHGLLTLATTLVFYNTDGISTFSVIGWFIIIYSIIWFGQFLYNKKMEKEMNDILSKFSK